MMPSLDDQERIFINKFVYHIEAISPGDVVVFRYPRDQSKSFIKRIIGIAGDRVRIDAGQVFVNDKPLAENYVATGFTDDRYRAALALADQVPACSQAGQLDFTSEERCKVCVGPARVRGSSTVRFRYCR